MFSNSYLDPYYNYFSYIFELRVIGSTITRIKINFRNQILKVAVNHNETTFTVDGDQDLTIIVNGKPEIASKFVQIN